MALIEARDTLKSSVRATKARVPPGRTGNAIMSRRKRAPSAKAPDAPRVRRPCIVLAPAGAMLDAALLATLDERDLTPRLEHHAEMAMAEVCLLRREVVQRAAHASDPEEIPPLIVIDSAHPDTNLLINALAQHLPDIPVLQPDTQGGLQQLQHSTARTRKQESEPAMTAQPVRHAEVNEDELSALLAQPTSASSAGADP